MAHAQRLPVRRIILMTRIRRTLAAHQKIVTNTSVAALAEYGRYVIVDTRPDKATIYARLADDAALEDYARRHGLLQPYEYMNTPARQVGGTVKAEMMRKKQKKHAA